MCTIVDYPDGSTATSIADLIERYATNATPAAFVDGIGLVPLTEAGPVGNECLCAVDVEAILESVGAWFIASDTGYEVRLSDDDGGDES